VVDGVTGFLVPPNDPTALADRLAELLNNPDLLRAMGHQAQRRAVAGYTWAQVARSIAAIYDEVAPGWGVTEDTAIGTATAAGDWTVG